MIEATCCFNCGYILDEEGCCIFCNLDEEELSYLDDEDNLCACGEELDAADLCPICDYEDEDEDYWADLEDE